MNSTVLERWNPSPEPLLQLVIDQNDDSMLREISAADYGVDADAHYAAIVHLTTHRDFTLPLEWEPREVLELIRWSQPEDPAWKPGATVERGHWMRLLACTLLLRFAAERQNYLVGEDSTIIQLVTSSIALGHEAPQAALSFLCWRLHIDPGTEEGSPYIALGILLLAIFLCDYDQERLNLLMENIKPDWLYSPVSLFSMRGQAWRKALKTIVLDDSLNDIKFVKEKVAEIIEL